MGPHSFFEMKFKYSPLNEFYEEGNKNISPYAKLGIKETLFVHLEPKTTEFRQYLMLSKIKFKSF